MPALKQVPDLDEAGTRGAVIDRTRPLTPALARCFERLAGDAEVLDVGCLGFRQVANAERLGRNDLRHFGVDFRIPDGGVPPGFRFREVDLSVDPIPFADDQFDLVIASHVIEHLPNPVDFFGDCLRVCRPGGVLYLEAPSERAALLPSLPFLLERHIMTSYYDDPTHQSRPWTPQAFYRLANFYGANCIETRHIVSWRRRLLLPFYLPYALVAGHGARLVEWIWDSVGWCCYAVVEKPAELRGRPPFTYYVPS